MSSLDVRNVVTSFIRNPKTGSILLGLRSSQVRTFQAHWAGISGSIEPDVDTSPYHCACREIEEETSLIVGRDLHLVRSGRPLLVIPEESFHGHEHDDEQQATFGKNKKRSASNTRRAYMVHPFLFLSQIENDEELITKRIKIDWEHERFEMFNPEVLMNDKLQFVPNLKETYQRVILPNEREFGPLIDSIKENKTDGAATIALFALNKVLRTIVSSTMTEQQPYTIDDIKNIAWFLYNARPTMAPIGNACIKAIGSYIQTCEVGYGGSSLINKQKLLSYIDRVTEELGECTLKIVDHVQQEIDNCMSQDLPVKKASGLTILTFSYSSTVVQVLRSCSSHIQTLIVSESRPDCEGLTTIEKVCDYLKDDTEIILCTEAALPSIVLSRDKYSIDMIITGADAILYNGSVTNKTGTYLLSLLSQQVKIPIYFLCDTFKVRARKQIPEELEQGSKESLLSNKVHGAYERLKNLNITNPIFETVPYSPNFKFVTERGIFYSASDMEIVSNQFQELYELLFSPKNFKKQV